MEKFGVALALAHMNGLHSLQLKWNNPVDSCLRVQLVKLLMRNRHTLRHVDLGASQSCDTSLLWATACCPQLETAVVGNDSVTIEPLFSAVVATQPNIRHLLLPAAPFSIFDTLFVPLHHHWRQTLTHLNTSSNKLGLTELETIATTFPLLETFRCYVAPVHRTYPKKIDDGVPENCMVTQNDVRAALSVFMSFRYLDTLYLRLCFLSYMKSTRCSNDWGETYKWVVPSLTKLTLELQNSVLSNAHEWHCDPFFGVCMVAPRLVEYTSADVWLGQTASVVTHSPALERIRVIISTLSDSAFPRDQNVNQDTTFTMDEFSTALLGCSSTSIRLFHLDVKLPTRFTASLTVDKWRDIVCRWPLVEEICVEIPSLQWNTAVDNNNNNNNNKMAILDILRVCANLQKLKFVQTEPAPPWQRWSPDTEGKEKAQKPTTNVSVARNLTALELPQVAADFWDELRLPKMDGVPRLQVYDHDLSYMLQSCARGSGEQWVNFQSIEMRDTRLGFTFSPPTHGLSLMWTHLGLKLSPFMGSLLQSLFLWTPLLEFLQLVGTTDDCFNAVELLRLCPTERLCALKLILRGEIRESHMKSLKEWRRQDTKCRIEHTGGEATNAIRRQFYLLSLPSSY